MQYQKQGRWGSIALEGEEVCHQFTSDYIKRDKNTGTFFLYQKTENNFWSNIKYQHNDS